MSLYDQIWSQEDYVPRKNVYLIDLPKNHLLKVQSVNFDFEEYKVNEKLACLPYERMTIRCANTYGAKFSLINAECRDIASFFKKCLKRTNPEYFAVSEYSREKPTFEEIKI